MDLLEYMPGGSMPVFVGWYSSEVSHSPVSVESEAGDIWVSKGAKVIGGFEAMQTPENSEVGIRTSAYRAFVRNISPDEVPLH